MFNIMVQRLIDDDRLRWYLFTLDFPEKTGIFIHATPKDSEIEKLLFLRGFSKGNFKLEKKKQIEYLIEIARISYKQDYEILIENKRDSSKMTPEEFLKYIDRYF